MNLLSLSVFLKQAQRFAAKKTLKTLQKYGQTGMALKECPKLS